MLSTTSNRFLASMARIWAEDNIPLQTLSLAIEIDMLILLPVVAFNCCVVVFLSELHAVDEITHVFGEDLVCHLHLSVSVGGEGGDESVHCSQQLPQLQTNLDI